MENKLYLLYETVNYEESGRSVPQVKMEFNNMGTPLTYLGEYYLKPFPLILDIPDFRFYGNAKLTDLVSSNFTGGPNLLVSPKLKDIFVQYSSPEKIQILDAKLFKRSKELDYHIIRFHYDLEAADMSKTIFTKKYVKNYRKQKEDVDFQAKHFFNAKEEGPEGRGGVRVKSLFIKEEMFKYDYFYIRSAILAWFISHRLAMHLLEEKITGISITPFEQGELFYQENLRTKIERKAIKK